MDPHGYTKWLSMSSLVRIVSQSWIRLSWLFFSNILYQVHPCNFGKMKPVHTGKLTWNLQITCLKKIIIFQIFIFKFHIDFQKFDSDLVSNCAVQPTNYRQNPILDILHATRRRNTSSKHLHPGRITWNLKITQLKRKIIFQTIIFRFHVNLPGCTSNLLQGPIGWKVLCWSLPMSWLVWRGELSDVVV